MITIPYIQRQILTRFATGFHEDEHDNSGFSFTRTAAQIQENIAIIVNTLVKTRTNSNPRDVFQAGRRKMFSIARKHPNKLLVRITDNIPLFDSECSR